jgi:hypothetical protein
MRATTIAVIALTARLYLLAAVAFLAGAGFLICPHAAAAAEQIPSDELAKLEPELCNSSSSFFQSLSAALPLLVGSATRDMTPEQVALIDQYKASGRRKLWVLRLPAAFIAVRTCDAGRTNWSGEGEHLGVDQHYRLSLLVSANQSVPTTRATKSELDAGVEVDIDLYNRVRDPAFIHRIYEKGVSVIGRIGVDGPQRCRDVPSDIPGLVTFKRIDPNVQDPMDCESGHPGGVFAKKLDDRVYDFIASCWVNCRIQRDYRGWRVEYSYHYTHLAEWQRLQDRLREFLDQHTAYLDQDSGNP